MLKLTPEFSFAGFTFPRYLADMAGWAPRPGIFHAVFPSRRGLVPAVRRFLDFLGESITREGLVD